MTLIEAGKGPLGDLISKYHLQKTAAEQIPKVRTWFSHLGGPALSLARKIVSGLGGVITVMVLTFLILLEGPGLVRGVLSGMPDRHARRIRRILDDVAKSVTGYVVGNTATSTRPQNQAPRRAIQAPGRSASCQRLLRPPIIWPTIWVDRASELAAVFGLMAREALKSLR